MSPKIELQMPESGFKRVWNIWTVWNFSQHLLISATILFLIDKDMLSAYQIYVYFGYKYFIRILHQALITHFHCL